MRTEEYGMPSGGVENAMEGAADSTGNTSLSQTPKQSSCRTRRMQTSSASASVGCSAASGSVNVEQTNPNAGQGQPVCMSQTQNLPVGSVDDGVACGVSQDTEVKPATAYATTGKEKRNELSNLPNPVMGDNFESHWPLGSISSSMFDSSEPLGFATLVSTFGSWMSAAFDKHDEEDGEDREDGPEENARETESRWKREKKNEKKREKEEEAGEENEENGEDEPARNIHHGNFGETAPEDISHSNNDGIQDSAGVKRSEASLDSSSLEFQLGILGQRPASPSQPFDEVPHDNDSHMEPQVFLHLCGQPNPIRWTPGLFVPTQNEELNSSDDTEDVSLQQTDPHLLQIPAPEVSTETENPLHSPSVHMSLRQVAENIEMWILDIGSQRVSGDEESVSSSDSLEETTGPALKGFEGDPTSRRYIDDANTVSDDGISGLNGDAPMLQPSFGIHSLLDGTSPSSTGSATKEERLVPRDRSLHSALLRSGTGDSPTVIQGSPRTSLPQQAAKEGSTRQHRTRNGNGSKIDKLHKKRAHRSRRYDKDTNSSARAATLLMAQDDSVAPLNVSEASEFIDGTENIDRKSAAEGTVVKEQLLACGAGENADPNTMILGELSAEEAAAKEYSVRSWGNRIWAFFRGGTEAETTTAVGDNPMDVVDQTLPFEDPAVVQRDDHRAFPSETSLLLESIKQEATLQYLSPQQQRYVASLMRRDIFPASTAIVEEGGEPALMWCSSGEFDVSQAGFFGVTVLRSLTPGEFFGMEELASGEKLKCTLTSRQSTSECVLWVLDGEIFNESVKNMLAKRKAFVPVAQSFLHTVRLVRDLPEKEITAVAKACKVERFAEGQTVFKMGFHGDMLCFIYKGEAITQKPQDDGGFLELARQGKGEYFGEMALIRNTRRTASVVAGTELVLFCLDKESFETLLSPLKDKMAVRAAQAAKAASTYKRQDEAPPTETEAKPADAAALAPVVVTRDAAEVCAKKRTRKNSLALLNYSKIRDQERQAENGESDAPEDKPTARWRLAREPESIHEPPPLCAQGGRSCLKENNPQGPCRKRKSPVRFDEGSLLPSDSSSDGD